MKRERTHEIPGEHCSYYSLGHYVAHEFEQLTLEVLEKHGNGELTEAQNVEARFGRRIMQFFEGSYDCVCPPEE
jgi:hypothetical protein